MFGKRKYRYLCENCVDLSVIFLFQLAYLSSLDRAVSAGRLTVMEKDALFTSAVERNDTLNSRVRLYVTCFGHVWPCMFICYLYEEILFENQVNSLI